MERKNSLSTLDFREWKEKNSLSTLDFREFDTETLVFSLDFLEFKSRVHSFIADSSKLINLNLFQRSDFTFSHLILIENFKSVSLLDILNIAIQNVYRHKNSDTF